MPRAGRIPDLPLGQKKNFFRVGKDLLHNRAVWCSPLLRIQVSYSQMTFNRKSLEKHVFSLHLVHFGIPGSYPTVFLPTIEERFIDTLSDWHDW